MVNKILSVGVPQRVIKAWGYEDIIYNGEYCSKILHYNTGAKSSFHYHKNKHEVWYCASGVFKLSYIDTESGKMEEKILIKDVTIIIDRCCPHRLECIKEGDIFESSTHHEDSDTYRIAAGDGQK